MKQLLFFFNYVEWFVVIIIFCICLKLNSILSTVQYLNLSIWFLIFPMLIGAVLAFHFDRDLDTDKLHNYNCKYRIDIFSINGITYYMPVIRVITHFGSFYEHLLEDDGSVWTRKDPDSVKAELNKDCQNIKTYLRDKLCFESEEEAHYSIANSKRILDEKRKKQNKVTGCKTKSINFE